LRLAAGKRNLGRFSEHFVFNSTPAEFADLKSQIVISTWGAARGAHGCDAFAEQRVSMISRVLESRRAAR
jgi:hypothetical protein